jgi:hypothetical protein
VLSSVSQLEPLALPQPLEVVPQLLQLDAEPHPPPSGLDRFAGLRDLGGISFTTFRGRSNNSPTLRPPTSPVNPCSATACSLSCAVTCFSASLPAFVTGLLPYCWTKKNRAIGTPTKNGGATKPARFSIPATARENHQPSLRRRGTCMSLRLNRCRYSSATSVLFAIDCTIVSIRTAVCAWLSIRASTDVVAPWPFWCTAETSPSRETRTRPVSIRRASTVSAARPGPAVRNPASSADSHVPRAAAGVSISYPLNCWNCCSYCCSNCCNCCYCWNN